ncbi:MAG: DNA ligase D, partial [bacterium]
LLLGVYDKAGDLVYVGRVGTGFDHKTLTAIHRRLRLLERKTSPFRNAAGSQGGVHWVEPSLVAEVAFRNWTRDGLIRQPVFLGLREDKQAKDVVREHPQAVERVTGRKSAHRTPARAARSSGGQPPGIAGVQLTNPDRILYPDQGLTKRALASFYHDIADWILPHVVDRPLTLVRCPEGYTKQCFYQKHADESTPEALKRTELEEVDASGTYMYVDGVAGLITLVQLGVLEIHPWGSRVDHPDRPDRLIFDLDPSPGVAWPQVVNTARWLHRRLSELGLTSFVKTTGGKGLHVVVPLAPVHGWDEVKAFSKAIAENVVRHSPHDYTINPLKAARKGKILVDYLRNARGATAVAAYSTRARAGAPVSTPVSWDELGGRLRSNTYTVSNLARRLARLKKDPWDGYFKLRQRITKSG